MLYNKSDTTSYLENFNKEDRFTLKHNKVIVEGLGNWEIEDRW